MSSAFRFPSGLPSPPDPSPSPTSVGGAAHGSELRGRDYRPGEPGAETDIAQAGVPVLVQRLPNFPADWPLPDYATTGAAAVDLRNAGPAFVLPSLGRRLVPTGLAIALPDGTEAQIRPRSGLAFRRGVGIVNSPCTIDSDYRGEIRIPLINLDAAPQEVEHGERIAQLLVARVARIVWRPADTLPETDRGTGGFGSTGR